MKTYTDAQVRSALAKLLRGSTYREVAGYLGIDAGNFYRMAKGTTAISIRVAGKIGFVLVNEPHIWTRKPRKEPRP